MAEERMASHLEQLSANPLRYKSCSYLGGKKPKPPPGKGVKGPLHLQCRYFKDKERRETVT